jgi:hypothetical protein
VGDSHGELRPGAEVGPVATRTQRAAGIHLSWPRGLEARRCARGALRLRRSSSLDRALPRAET